MNNHYDAIVVGAGPGGSAAAALLAKKGKKILLVDKNKSAGGRMMIIHGKENAVSRIDPKKLGLKDIMYLMDIKGDLRSNEMGGMYSKTLKSLRISLLNPKHLIGLNRIKKIISKHGTNGKAACIHCDVLLSKSGA